MGLFKRKRKEVIPVKVEDQVVEELVDNDPENYIFSSEALPEEYRDGRIFVHSWNFQTGDLVCRGDHLAEFSSYKHSNITLNIDADSDGVIEIFKLSSNRYSSKIDFIEEGEKTHTIYRNPTPVRIPVIPCQ